MTPVNFAQAAIALQLLPIFIVLVARSRRDRELWEIALDIPFAVALDLLGILLLTRVVTLETSILISRPAWLLFGAGACVRAKRRGELAWPRALGLTDVVCAACAALVAVLISQQISRSCHVADRAWHSSLLVSLRGQTIPFVNVYQPNLGLAYHYSGDVLGAVLQVLSGGVLQASNALSWAHDVAFGLTGASAALLFRSLGFRSVAGACLAALGVLLSGPITILRPDRPEGGYNFIDLLKLSYRPHVCLATLLFVGFVGALVVRASPRREPIPLRKTAPILLVCTSILAITDETSLGLVGLGLGAAWIVDGEVLAPNRKLGAAVLAGMLVTLIVASLVFVSALAPGAPKHAIKLVAWRSPGYLNNSIPLTVERGREMLYYDVAPMVGIFIVGVLARLRTSRRGVTPQLAFLAVIFVAGIIGLCRIDVDNASIENHRFMTAAMFTFPFVGATWLPWMVKARGPGLPSIAGRFAAPLFVVAAGLSAASSLWWMQSVGKQRWCTKPKNYGSSDDFFQTNCRSEAGAALGEAPRPTYVEKPIYFIHAGCRPSFTSGPIVKQWALRIGFPEFGQKALTDFHKNMLKPEEPLKVVCQAKGSVDPICLAAMQNGSCKPAGTRLIHCELSGPERAALLEKLSKPSQAPAEPEAPPVETSEPK